MDDDSSEDDELEKTTTSMLQMEYQAELMDDFNMKMMSNGLRKGSSNASLPKHSSQGSLALETIEVQPQLS